MMSLGQDNKPIFTICCFLSVWGFIFLYGCATSSPPAAPSSPPSVSSAYSKPPASSAKTKPYRVGSKWYYPMAQAHDFRQKGIASWYGKKFHGRKTSSGEVYDMYAMTAAHKTLPLGTYVKVRHAGNGKETVVKVNDRGPFVRGRIIDLSYTAAKKIDIIGTGTARVEIVALGKAVPSKARGSTPRTYRKTDYSKGNFTIQIGAFTDKKNALRLQQKLDPIYKNVHIASFQNGGETLHRVRVGRCSTLKQAEEYEQILIKGGFAGAMIVAE
jgi:peptidoglycan lytic transglycosylase